MYHIVTLDASENLLTELLTYLKKLSYLFSPHHFTPTCLLYACIYFNKEVFK